ncbi:MULTISPECIES: hypothetical protein [Winogradskyella]|uniref:hypothetical protein n=1 Tax=Winogradskyella TaxID=286104 RepID=UPI0015CA3652|nr:MULTISPECIES: hypothetical protein [Winogradskyella]QXP79210.1 hypothetical protein H0I32_00730 [Winogradskyella sp. HaHa_3_26]
MKNLHLVYLFFVVSTISFSQNIESSTRKFIDEAQFTRINRWWGTLAEFKSGIGESVEFYPIEVINLKTGEKRKALQLDMHIKQPKEVFKTVWIGLEEINEFIRFIEDYVLPNLDIQLPIDSSSEFVFKAKEMTLSYFIDNKRKRLTIKLNNYDDCLCLYKNYTFWTKTQVDKISKLLDILKIIK